MTKKERAGQVQVHEVNVINDFLAGKAENTKQAYDRDLETFRQFLDVSTTREAVRQLLSFGNGPANSLVLKFKNHLMTSPKKYSANTINRKLYALKALVKTARLVGAVPWVLEFEKLKTETIRDTRGPGLDTFKAMLQNVSKEGRPKSARDYAMLRLFFDMGLRRSSIICLDTDDINLDENKISIFLKGRREKRIKEIPESTRKALKNWLDVRGYEEGPVFVSMDRNGDHNGHRITGNGVYKIVRELSEKAGKKTRPHGLRHLAITEAIKETARRGLSIAEVTKFSDHANVSTLMLYNDGIDGIQGKISSWVSSLA